MALDTRGGEFTHAHVFTSVHAKQALNALSHRKHVTPEDWRGEFLLCGNCEVCLCCHDIVSYGLQALDVARKELHFEGCKREYSEKECLLGRRGYSFGPQQ